MESRDYLAEDNWVHLNSVLIKMGPSQDVSDGRGSLLLGVTFYLRFRKIPEKTITPETVSTAEPLDRQ